MILKKFVTRTMASQLAVCYTDPFLLLYLQQGCPASQQLRPHVTCAPPQNALWVLPVSVGLPWPLPATTWTPLDPQALGSLGPVGHAAPCLGQ